MSEAVVAYLKTLFQHSLTETNTMKTVTHDGGGGAYYFPDTTLGRHPYTKEHNRISLTSS
jgi:hypothetical protein